MEQEDAILMLPSPREFRELVANVIDEETREVTDLKSYSDCRLDVLCGVGHDILYGKFAEAGLSCLLDEINHHVLDYAVMAIEEAIENNDAYWGILCYGIVDKLNLDALFGDKCPKCVMDDEESTEAAPPTNECPF